MAWPTLTHKLAEKQIPIDTAIKHDTEDGHVIRRPRYTRTLHKYELVYDWLSKAEADLLWTHWEAVETYLEFTWTDHLAVAHQVVFDTPLVRTPRAKDTFYLFDTIILKEV